MVTLNEDPDRSGPLPERQRRLLEVEPHRLELIALVGHVHITADVLQLFPLVWNEDPITRGLKLSSPAPSDSSLRTGVWNEDPITRGLKLCIWVEFVLFTV